MLPKFSSSTCSLADISSTLETVCKLLRCSNSCDGTYVSVSFMMLRVEVRGIRTLAAFKLAQSNVSKTGLQFMLMIILYMIVKE